MSAIIIHHIATYNHLKQVTTIQCIYPTWSQRIPVCIKFVLYINVWMFNLTVLELDCLADKYIVLPSEGLEPTPLVECNTNSLSKMSFMTNRYILYIHLELIICWIFFILSRKWSFTWHCRGWIQGNKVLSLKWNLSKEIVLIDDFAGIYQISITVFFFHFHYFHF
jgi:hypothetical protein